MANYSIKMPVWLQIVLGFIALVAIACFVVWMIALAKDMSFIEYIKSWFTKTEVTETAEQVASCIIFRR